MAITLRFLATAESYRRLMNLFKVTRQSISLMIPHVTEALKSLTPDASS